ncbi:MAG: sulfotransferase [Bacteroidales bacterium]|nr:sulfotransferase [Bacteroidales bacterium]
MKSAYLIAGMRLSRFIKLIFKNGMALYPKYFIRFLFLLQNGVWASIFYRKEKKLFKQKIEQHSLSDNPIIIVGHWRTGSTFLHQLLALDKNLITTNVFQGSIPDSFLSSRKSYEPIMGRALKGTRPMDQVKLSMDEPLEDEYALFRLSSYSPLERLIFPKSKEYFLNLFPGFLPEGKKLKEWKEALVYFYKKLTLLNNKTILIKNPFHSYRIKVLNEIFPNARYIHIIRNPHKVVPSTIRMWDIVGKQNAMNTKWQKPSVKDTAGLYKSMLLKLEDDLKTIPESRCCEIKFEDLEKDPISHVKGIYKQLNVQFSSEFEQQMSDFLLGVKEYKKNKYEMPEDDKLEINEILGQWMNQKKYAL